MLLLANMSRNAPSYTLRHRTAFILERSKRGTGVCALAKMLQNRPPATAPDRGPGHAHRHEQALAGRRRIGVRAGCLRLQHRAESLSRRRKRAPARVMALRPEASGRICRGVAQIGGEEQCGTVLRHSPSLSRGLSAKVKAYRDAPDMEALVTHGEHRLLLGLPRNIATSCAPSRLGSTAIMAPALCKWRRISDNARRRPLASNQPARYLVVVGRANRLGTEINNDADI